MVAGWHARADRSEWESLVAELLTAHYDPAYRRSTHKNYARLADAHVVRPRELSPASIASLATELLALAARERAVA
jgi:tRNA 2-selenouridine synthase